MGIANVHTEYVFKSESDLILLKKLNQKIADKIWLERIHCLSDASRLGPTIILLQYYYHHHKFKMKRLGYCGENWLVIGFNDPS